MSYHQPVMLQEVLHFLAPSSEKVFCDATLGGGGHSLALLQAGAKEVIGVDQDPDALAFAKGVLAPYRERVRFHCANFRDLPNLLSNPVSGILLDLGVSSAQLDRAERGFSFRHDGPLDMRMGQEGKTLSELLEKISQEELANLIFAYGEERKSRPIARAILKARDQNKLSSTLALANVIRSVFGFHKPGTIDPATRTFQALRIALNEELDVLKELLYCLPALLLPGGVAVVLSYHSLEDRLCKQAFRAHAKGCICPRDLPICACGKTPSVKILTSRPQVASAEEVQKNPRARSAKLRAAKRLEEMIKTP